MYAFDDEEEIKKTNDLDQNKMRFLGRLELNYDSRFIQDVLDPTYLAIRQTN